MSPATPIKDRYILDPTPERKGGMAVVRKAYDPQTGQFVALKFLERLADEMRSKNSFFREFAALDALKHNNIVKLLDTDRTEEGVNFLVLEWLERNLDEWTEESPFGDYEEFMFKCGDQILDAIIYAQSQRYAHRDLKPRNILLTESNVPKIADYGISKYVDGLLPSHGTFAPFSSPPFTPKEDDDGLHTFTRDVYSFASIMIYCLAGGIENIDEENLTKEQKYALLNDAFIALVIGDDLRKIIERCLSEDPRDRFPTASALQGTLEQYESQKKSQNTDSFKKCYLKLSPRAQESIGNKLGDTRAQVIESFILEELNEACSFSKYKFGNEGIESPRELTLWGITWALRLTPERDNTQAFNIVHAWQMSPADIERLRENGCYLPLHFSFAKPKFIDNGKNLSDNIIAEVAAHEFNRENDAKANVKSHFFKRFYAFLSAKSEIERRNQESIPFHSRSIFGDTATIKSNDFFPDYDDLTERVIRLESGFVIQCEITNAKPHTIDVTPLNAQPNDIPISGNISLNTNQMSRAIEKQRIALDSVVYNRCVNPLLKSLLIEPSQATPPERIEKIELFQDEIDSDKLGALNAALGNNNIVAIQGPPGTGKTTLIAEIVLQYLKRNPLHRILLSSQTHIALDNVIERVCGTTVELEIVRIGRPEDPKIADAVKPLLLESKVKSWAEKVAKNAESFFKLWAESSDIDSIQIGLGVRVEKLIVLLRTKALILDKLHSTNAAKISLDEQQDQFIDDKGGVTSNELEYETEGAQEEIETLNQQLSAMNQTENTLRKNLSTFNTDGSELSKLSFNELSEWLNVFLPDEPAISHFRKLLEISEEWILRVGKTQDFYPAILGSSQVIAGTCIGMASVPGIQDVSFDLCIIDEASKATPTEVLVPMARSKKWVLVGDPKQLPPFIEQEFQKDNDLIDEYGLSTEFLKETLLERFLTELPKHSAKELNKQYRMVEGIGNLVSHCFYNEKLESEKKESDLDLTPSFATPVTWLSTSSLKTRHDEEVGNSHKNSAEVTVVIRALKRIEFIAKAKRKKISIAIIAGYIAQVDEIDMAIDRETRFSKWLDISCNSVDAFQGRQADICIYSVTRSNTIGKIGFLREFPRLNVALSRAKSHLIIVGDHVFCRTAKGENPFVEVIKYIEMNSTSCTIEDQA